MAVSNEGRLLAAGVEQSELPVCITTAELDPPGPMILYVNEAFIRLTGYTRDELVGATPRICQGPATDRAVLDRFKSSLRAGDPFEGRTWNYRKDGTPYQVRWSVTPLRLEGEAIDYFFSVQRDVTAHSTVQEELEDEARRMNALLHSAGLGERPTDLAARLADLIDSLENQAREAESARDHLRSILKSSPVGIALINRERRIQQVNPAFERLFGYPAHEVIGGSIYPLYVDEASFERVGAQAYAAIATEGHYETTVELRRSDGQIVTVQMNGQAVSDSAEQGNIWAFQDITESKRAEAELREQSRLLEIAGRVARLGGFRVDLAEYRVIWSSVAANIHAMPPDSSPTLDEVYAFYVSGHRERIRARVTDCVEHGVPFDEELELIDAEGRRVWVRALGEPIYDNDGTIVRIQGAVQDVTDRHEHEQRLRKLASIIDQNPAALAITDLEGRIEYVNAAFERISGYPGAELVGGTPARVKSGLTPDAVYRELWETITAGRTWRGQLQNRRKDGTPYWEDEIISPLKDERGEIINYFAIKQDITELKQAEQRLSRLAYEDVLTGLPSRNGLVAAIEAILDSPAGCAGATLVMLDLEGQRDINDVYGFAAGDRLLIAVGERLCAELGDDAVVARIGGDEFMVFLPAGDDATAARRRAAVGHAVERPFTLEDATIEVSAHYGYTVLGTRGRSVDALLREAELALLQSRAVGADRWFAYTSDLDAASQNRIQITREMRRALANDEFELHFQPKVDLETGGMVAAEALIRWQHPERGLQSPAKFIPVAEQSQLIGPIGDWTLHEACRLLGEWQADGLEIVRISVNISIVQFRLGDVASTVADAINAHGIDPSALTLEITESVFEQESDWLLAQLRAIRDLGVRLSMDDFGTGYSSLLYLQRYPFDELKIDQGFVRGMRDNDYSHRIVTAVVSIALGLGLELVAEGIETPDLAKPLLALDCRVGQGYYYSMPLTTADFRWLLEQPTALPMASDT